MVIDVLGCKINAKWRQMQIRKMKKCQGPSNCPKKGIWALKNAKNALFSGEMSNFFSFFFV